MRCWFLVVFFLFLMNLGHSQDTVYVKKAPVLIKKEVYYANSKSEVKENVLTIEYAIDQYVKYSNESTYFKTSTKALGVRYGKKVKRLTFGGGIGYSSAKINVSTVYENSDSTSYNRIDTLDSYFQVVNNDTSEVFVTDTTEIWEVYNITREENRLIGGKYIRVPVFVSYSIHKKKWGVTLRSELLINSLVGGSDFEVRGETYTMNRFLFQYQQALEIGYAIIDDLSLWCAIKGNRQLNSSIKSSRLDTGLSYALGAGLNYSF